MRSLPFPTEAAYNREDSHEWGTPQTDDIPIDPALVPALVVSQGAPNVYQNGWSAMREQVSDPHPRSHD
jgi:hypothetical protein